MWVIWNGTTVAWELEWFDKSDELRGSIFLEKFGEEDMRPVLLVYDNSIFEGAYPLDEARAARLQELIDVEIDLGKYDYFIGVVDTGLTKPDRFIKASDFPEHEVWYPPPRFLSGAFKEAAAVTPKRKVK